MSTAGCSCCAYPPPPGRWQRTRASVAVEHPLKTAISHTLLLDGGSVVDPRDGRIATDVSIRIQDGMVIDIGPRRASSSASPSVQRIDVAGAFIVPGYNDMHSHVLNLADPSASLGLMLAEGVTGFRQMSGSPALLEKRRDHRLPIGPAAPALLQTPGDILTPLNAGSPEAAAAEIRRQHAQGADFVKMVMAAPDVFMAAVAEATAVGIPILGHLQEGVDVVAAARAGFRSVEHLGPGSSVWAACSTLADRLQEQAAGRPVITAPPIEIPFLDRIVAWRMQKMLVNPAAFSDPVDVERIQAALDTFSIDRAAEVADRLAESGTWQVPTLVRLRSMELAGFADYDDDDLLTYMPEKNVRRWRTVTAKFLGLPAAAQVTYRALYPRQLQLAKLFADRGVPMMTGTDGGAMMAPGLTLRQEFGQLAEAGFTPLEILQMTTVNPARYLAREGFTGAVERGCGADLVVLGANPLDAVENLHCITAVVRAGRYFSAADLDGLKAAAASTRRHRSLSGRR